MRMFKRVTRITIAGKTYEYPDLDIEFDVPKTLNENPDVAEVRIYNLSDGTVSGISQDAKIVIEAGYENNWGVIFEGRIEKVLPEWSGTDKEVTILATNLGSGFRYKEVEKTYKGKTVRFIINDLIRTLGVRAGEVRVAHNKSFKEYSVNGNIFMNIKKLAEIGKSKMFTRNGKIYIRPYDQSGKSGFILNHNTGLIGTPVREVKEVTEGEKTKRIVEYKLSSLLNHEIDQDTWIKVESSTLNGKFRVIEVKHTRNFLTEILVRP